MKALYRTCSHPGCKARVAAYGPHTACSRHRPRTDQDRKPKTEEYRAVQRERERRRRLLSGLPGGWEVT